MIPEIIIDDKKYVPVKPKAKVWRAVVELEDNKQKIKNAEIIDEYARVIALVFGIPEITKDCILDNIDLDEIKPLYYICANWVIDQINSKIEQIPNGQTPKE